MQTQREFNELHTLFSGTAPSRRGEWTGCSWILETLRLLEFKSADPIFKYFSKDLSLTPTGYSERRCFIGACLMPAREGRDRHKIGLDKGDVGIG